MLATALTVMAIVTQDQTALRPLAEELRGDALRALGRTDEARQLFEEMLNRRTAAGLLSEDIAFDGAELWGNYPQTYSLVGLINCATMLSKPWASVR